MNWIDVIALTDIPRQGARVVAHAGRAIAVFRTADDRVYALEDRCPHKGGPLSQGIVHGDRVACPLHGRTIELATGEVVAPDKGCARAWPVRLEGERVWLGSHERIDALA